MAKKKSVQLSVSSEEVGERQELEQAPVVEEYSKGTWAGRPHYQCNLCPYDALNDEGQMLEHIQLKHRPALAANRRGKDVVSLADLTPNPSPLGEGNEGRGEDEDGLFEVELKEVSSATDEHGNEHKIFTIKE